MVPPPSRYDCGRVRLVLMPNAVSVCAYLRTARHCRHSALNRRLRSDPRELANVYLIIAHYLTHTAEIDAYLSQRQTEAAELQRAIETRFNPVGIRARLLARRH